MANTLNIESALRVLNTHLTYVYAHPNGTAEIYTASDHGFIAHIAEWPEIAMNDLPEEFEDHDELEDLEVTNFKFQNETIYYSREMHTTKVQDLKLRFSSIGVMRPLDPTTEVKITDREAVRQFLLKDGYDLSTTISLILSRNACSFTPILIMKSGVINYAVSLKNKVHTFINAEEFIAAMKAEIEADHTADANIGKVKKSSNAISIGDDDDADEDEAHAPRGRGKAGYGDRS